MLVGALFPRSDLSQLGRLADLKAHYLEHKAEAEQQNASITFFDFLSIHYLNTQQHNSNTDHEEDHHQLPFQSINGSVTFLLTTVLLPVFSDAEEDFIKTIAYQCPFYLNGFLSTTIQPPSFL